MKKFLLFVSLILMSSLVEAQIVFFVEPPSTNSANYNMNYADAADGWGCPDMTLTANAITGTICMADDGTAADSLACVNSVMANVSGNIAVLYRGDCEFGSKAFHCQNAGAIGVIIIDNIPEDVTAFGMLGGTDGPSVTIPVVMISDVDGALLKAEAEACAGTTVFIGNKTGFYGHDLGFYAPDVLRAKRFTNLQALSQDASEFEVELGAWVKNYGSMDQTNVTLNCVINNGMEVYNETSTPESSLLAGDSIFIALPTYSASSYTNGYYNTVYTIGSDDADELVADNSIGAHFVMSDSLYSYCRISETTNLPENSSFSRGLGSTISNTSCIAFNDPNASRMAVDGLTFSAATLQNPDPSTIDGEFVQVFAYSWGDSFTDIFDADVSIIDEIAEGEYLYENDLQQENIYVPFEVPVLLEDNQNYLFCLAHLGENLYTGHDTGLDYNTNLNTFSQPMFPIEVDATWNVVAYGTDIVPAITVNLFEATASLEEYTPSNLTAYPNPANAEVNIPLNENFGAVSLTITDMSGKIVNTQNIEMAGSILTVDVTTLASGSYVFNVSNGEKSEVITVSVNR